MLSENNLSPATSTVKAVATGKRMAARNRVKTRKLLLSIHLVAVSLQIGVITALLGLQLISGFNPEISRRAVIYDAIVALEYFGLYPVIAIAILSGVVIGIYNHSGFLTAWWLIVKQGVFALAGVAMAIFIGPASPTLADQAYASKTITPEVESFQFSITAALSFYLAVLIFIVVISVFKPWGRRR